MKEDIFIPRERIEEKRIDIGGRDLLIAFGEPAMKSTGRKDGTRLGSKLNARLPAYILPAVQFAKMQECRPRLLLINGINFGLRWNARRDEERKVMLMNNALKVDFILRFLEHFYPDSFSIIEHIVSQDILKISERKLLQLWSIFERRYPDETESILEDLKRFARISEDDDIALHQAIAYAVGHLFGTGDINFEGNYVHNPVGYATLGGDREKVFNKVRGMILPIVKDFAEIIFDRPTIVKDNIRIVVETKEKVPPPYNGFFTKNGAGNASLAEMTYESGRDISFYEKHNRLYEDIEYIHSLVGKEEYARFWEEYRSRYEDLTSRYREAYGMDEMI